MTFLDESFFAKEDIFIGTYRMGNLEEIWGNSMCYIGGDENLCGRKKSVQIWSAMADPKIKKELLDASPLQCGLGLFRR